MSVTSAAFLLISILAPAALGFAGSDDQLALEAGFGQLSEAAFLVSIALGWVTLLMFLGIRLGAMFPIGTNDDLLPLKFVSFGVGIAGTGIAVNMIPILAEIAPSVFFATAALGVMSFSAGAFVYGFIPDKPTAGRGIGSPTLL